MSTPVRRGALSARLRAWRRYRTLLASAVAGFDAGGHEMSPATYERIRARAREESKNLPPAAEVAGGKADPDTGGGRAA